MKTYFLTYADDRFGYRDGLFRSRQAILNESAKKHGMDEMVALTWDDMVTTEFYREHKAYVDKNCFHNGHVFKPFLLLQQLEKVETGDVIFYHDCGPRPFTRSLQPLVELCVGNGGTLFHQWGDQNRNWVKRDAFVYMELDTPKYHNAVSLQATWLLIQKNDFTVAFVREWLKYNLDERIASYVMADTCGLPPLEGFVINRGDQSIFSLLAAKHRVKSFYGQGAEANRNVELFLRSIPRHFADRLYWLAVEQRRKMRRRGYVANYFAEGKPNYLRGDIPQKFRDHPYPSPEIYGAEAEGKS